jgi:hypothetical protein
VYCAGILPLVLMDCSLILSRMMSQRSIFTADQWPIWGFVQAIYLTSMAVAMYPGRMSAPQCEWDDVAALRIGN